MSSFELDCFSPNLLGGSNEVVFNCIVYAAMKYSRCGDNRLKEKCNSITVDASAVGDTGALANFFLPMDVQVYMRNGWYLPKEDQQYIPRSQLVVDWRSHNFKFL